LSYHRELKPRTPYGFNPTQGPKPLISRLSGAGPSWTIVGSGFERRDHRAYLFEKMEWNIGIGAVLKGFAYG